MRAGTLEAASVFENILSIGYEMETHDLVKLSQKPASQAGTNTLMNAPTTLSTISVGLKDGSVVKLNDNEYRINDDYVEYFTETPEPNVMLNITNDIGDSLFTMFLKSLCSGEVPKNDTYVLKVIDEYQQEEEQPQPTYNINFVNELNSNRNCFSFSGVEWIVTYYNPEPSADLIMETYLGACDIVYEHLRRWNESYAVEFLVNGDNSIGELLIFKNPANNLVYMQTQPFLNNMTHAQSLGNVAVMPQMTFRARITHMVDIIKQMAANPWLNVPAIRNLTKQYNIIAQVDTCVREMMNRQQLVNADVFGYLWFILYKLHVYVTIYSFTDKAQDGNYFKNYVMFMPRKSNIQLYRRMKGIIDSQRILDIVNQPDLVKRYIYTRPDGAVPINGTAATADASSTDAAFGDPIVSFISYFQHLEKLDDDWLVVTDIDAYTGSGGDGAVFTDDTLLVENRLFYLVFEAYFQTNITNLRNQRFDTLNDMRKLRKKLITNKHDNPMEMTLRKPLTEPMKPYSRNKTQIKRIRLGGTKRRNKKRPKTHRRKR